MRSKDKRKLEHGTLEKYKAERCRCKECRDIWELYISEYRENIFDETRAKYKPVEVNTYNAYKEYKLKDWEVNAQS